MLLSINQQVSKANSLTLNVQEHALLVASDPAQSLTVESTQVCEPHAADGQHRLPMAAAHLEASVLTLKTQRKK